jgi:hypothetical protein
MTTFQAIFAMLVSSFVISISIGHWAEKEKLPTSIKLFLLWLIFWCFIGFATSLIQLFEILGIGEV